MSRGIYREVDGRAVYFPSQEEQAAEVRQERYRVRLQRIRLTAEQKQAAAGDAAAIAAVDEWFNDALERADQQYEQAVEEAARGGIMGKHDDAYTAAQAALTTGLVAAAAALKALEAKAATGEVTEKFAQVERDRILTEARVGDARAATALRAYTDGALKEARALRARAAVGDPQTVVAEELLRARLTADTRYDADNYVEEAQTWMEAEQPARAALLAEVAAQKGARVPTALSRAINDALDASVPDRQSAREIEQAVDANTAAFRVSRAQALADTLGTDAQGNVGNGSLSERTVASVQAKMGAYLAPQPAGDA